uniref:Secreted protein n=1 Tax=Steinernema glaseri TaxID=37863 RepID=A0A1I7ZF47_9BILA
MKTFLICLLLLAVAEAIRSGYSCEPSAWPWDPRPCRITRSPPSHKPKLLGAKGHSLKSASAYFAWRQPPNAEEGLGNVQHYGPQRQLHYQPLRRRCPPFYPNCEFLTFKQYGGIQPCQPDDPHYPGCLLEYYGEFL